MQIDKIKGVGPKSVSLLNKLNIYTKEDLVTFYPFRYEIIKRTSLYNDKAIVPVKIVSTPVLNYFKKMNRLSFKAESDNKLINVVIFNRGFLKNSLYVGNVVTIIGKYEEEKNTFLASDIKLEDINNKVKIEPIYHLVKGLTNKSMNKFIMNALDEEVIDYIPNELINKYNFMSKKDALKHIHFPLNNIKLKEAIIRCKYEELFLFMLKIEALKRKNNEYNIGYSKNIDKDKINEFINSLSFSLTNDQLKVLDEIYSDLEYKLVNKLIENDKEVLIKYILSRFNK